MSLLKRRPRQLGKRAQFKVLAEAGLTYRRIEEMLGICHATAHKWARQYGIPARKPGRPEASPEEKLVAEEHKRRLKEEEAALREGERVRIKAEKIALLERELERVRNE